ncbi:hypothetical protein FKM82_030083 [Ascaphus truei]
MLYLIFFRLASALQKVCQALQCEAGLRITDTGVGVGELNRATKSTGAGGKNDLTCSLGCETALLASSCVLPPRCRSENG